MMTHTPSGGCAPTAPRTKQESTQTQMIWRKIGRKRALRTLLVSSQGRKNRIRIEENMMQTPPSLFGTERSMA